MFNREVRISTIFGCAKGLVSLWNWTRPGATLEVKTEEVSFYFGLGRGGRSDYFVQV